MTKAQRRSTTRSSHGPSSSRIELSRQEVEALIRVATHYERSMGPMRHFIRLTGGSETRRRLSFITEEGRWLRLFARTTLKDLDQGGHDSAEVAFTSGALIAFWSRLIASLESRRSRRRLSAAEVQLREDLSRKFGIAARDLSRRHPTLLERELQTRRPREADRMRQELQAVG